MEGWGHIRTTNVDLNDCEDSDDADEEEEASYTHHGSMQTVEDSRYSTREWVDWTVYFRPVIYDKGEANAMASDASETMSELL